tara:strand:- start:456 stop:617 length:162 start_codon:yes stop_codon:yes gene_type:complete
VEALQYLVLLLQLVVAVELEEMVLPLVQVVQVVEQLVKALVALLREGVVIRPL